MTERRTIFCYTAPDIEYPPYLKIDADSDGIIYVTMRGTKQRPYSDQNPYCFPMPGEVTTFELPYEFFADLETAIKDNALQLQIEWLSRRGSLSKIGDKF